MLVRFLLLAMGLHLACLFAGSGALAQHEITLADVFQKGTFAAKTVPGFNALRNGKEYTQLDAKLGLQEINKYDLETGKKKGNIAAANLLMRCGTITDYAFSADEKKMLLFADDEAIYRRSILHHVWVYDLKSQELSMVDTALVLHAQFNPAATRVAFVKDNNLFVKNLADNQLVQVTNDGKKNNTINGNCDWVYEEEWEFTQAYQWSADGRYIAYYRFDESAVKQYTIPLYDEGNIYPDLYTYKYPKAGEANSVVGIRVYNTATGTTATADVGSETDQYIPRIKWAGKTNVLCVYQLNRLQNKLQLLMVNPDNGSSRLVYKEDSKWYVEINDNLQFNDAGTQYLYTSEKDGYRHLYLHDLQTGSDRQLTRGTWDVDCLTGVGFKQNTVYYTAGKTSPTGRKLYKLDWETTVETCLTNADGTHEITPCQGFSYFLDKHSAYNQVPVYSLIDNSGKPIRVLEDNGALRKTMGSYNVSPVGTLSVPNERGYMLNAWIIKPNNFDSTKKYPVLMFQYSGPGSQQVLDKFPVAYYFWYQMLAQKGYIIVCADGTGTGGRGTLFKDKTYLELGRYESDDQIAVAKYMARQPYVDAGRIGIWGWSFGGFMSATCILKGADVFKAAVAVAPVTNWRYYDNIYTERYMRTPAENPKGYDENAPEKMAAKLKGNFLLIHGTADDNVHFQNAVMLTDQLIKANKQFESEYYPNKNHGIGGGITRLQLFQRITDFLLEKL
ncbi:MAG: S9 family peptidase [Edaphocola sp.]